MKIKTKILLTVLGMSLLVALVGGLAVNRQRVAALVAVTTEAEHVARVLGFLISDPANLPASTQEIIARLHRTQGRDVVLIDPQQHILADAVPAEIGKIYAWDLHHQVGLTIKDHRVRTFTEVSNDSPVPIRQIVVPVEAVGGKLIGAVILEYTPFYDEQMRLATATIREVGLIGSAGAGMAVLLALYLGRSITAPLRQLTQAATRFTEGQRDLPLPSSGTDEIGELVAALNRMMEKRGEAEEALRRIHGELEARVTERTAELTAASEALTWKTAFLEASVNSSLDGILVVDSHGKKILQNQQMIDVWKMPRDIAEEQGDENRLRWVTGMTKHPEQFIAKVVHLYSHPHEISQDEIEMQDGTILERYSSPVFGRDGQYCGRIWKFRDITERKRAEETLRESEEKFRQLADHITDAFWIRSPDMKTVHLVTAGYEKIWGRPAASMYAHPEKWVDAMIPEDREHVLAAYAGLMGGEPQLSVEYRIARPDGTIRWVHARGFQVRDAAGKLVRLAGIVSDITERKQADLAQARFAAIMEMTTDFVCVADPHGGVLYINRAGRRMMGFDEHEDVTGTSIADYHADQSVPVAAREGVWSGESMFVSREGRQFPLAQVVLAHKGPDGKVDFVATTGQDLTERKKADAALEEANRLVRDGFRQAGMAEVATSVLHNVGNVLNSVNVSCSVISDQVRKLHIGSVAKIAELLGEHADDLAPFLTTHPIGQKLPGFFGKLAHRLSAEQTEILRELLSLDQNIEHIKDVIDVQQSYARDIGGLHETLPFEGLVEDALRINGGALVRHRIEVIRDYGEVPPVPMEKHKVIQILVNLIRNAKHALNDGGREQKRLAIGVARHNGGVAVTVTDNGVGIAPENISRIFAHGFTTKKDGHGFGLHSGALAAREMGGSLVAHSDGPGCGATFTLLLPVSAPGKN
jgi:PAS domain S-box-containing protein